MEGAEPPAGCSRSLSQFPLWIIEHVWTHNRMEALSGLDASCWPAVDLQPELLEEPWRWRVASACVFAIVRSRDLPRFERAVDFLDAAHRRLPGLVPAIKHMKVQFGLKTMVIMRMLRDGRGSPDVVAKINRFFPDKLPQYQHQCSRREMLLMRKNQQDFKRLAQTLALDRNRLRLYVQHQMEQQYGERYAQKVEDRLLQYLHRLQAAIPGETHIDRLLGKRSPASEEEELLLAVVASDCASMTAAVRKLLQRDAPSCAPPPERGGQTAGELRPGGPRRSEEEVLAVGGLRPPEDAGQRRVSSSPPQFCSKHGRWVRSILQECPDDGCRHAASLSPPLFQSSSSTSSSQDLTPSDLVPCPAAPAGRTSEPNWGSPGGTDARSQDLPSGDVTADPTQKRQEASPDGVGRGRRRAARVGPPAPPRASASRVGVTPPHPDGASSSIGRRFPVKRASSGRPPQRRPTCGPQGSPQLPLKVHRSCPGGCPSLSQARREPEVWTPSPPASTSWTAAGGRTDSGPPPSSSTGHLLPARMLPVVPLVDIVSRRRIKTNPSSPAVCPPAPPRPSGDKEAPPLQTPSDGTSPPEPPSSRPLQPYVRLTRLRAADCPPIRAVAAAAAEPPDDDSASSFDLNELYSDSSGSGGEEAPDGDPDYRPCIKKRRLMEEYENARMPRLQLETLSH